MDLDYKKLLLAARGGSLQELVDLEKMGYDIHHVDMFGKTPLMVSAKYDNVEILQHIVGKTSKDAIDYTDNDGRTALHEATWMGSLESAQILVDKGANPNAIDTTSNKYNVVEIAVFRGHMQILEVLVHAGGRVHSRLVNGARLLNYTCERGDAKMAEFLVRYVPEDLNERDRSQMTPLEHALHRPERLEIARMLLDKGASMNTVGEDWGYGFHDEHKTGEKSQKKYGWTPLAFACLVAEPESMRLLLERGADIHTMVYGGSRQNDLQLMDIVIRLSPPQNTEAIIDLLTAYGYDMEEQNGNGHTCLMRAVIKQNERVVKALIKRVSLNVSSYSCRTGFNSERYDALGHSTDLGIA